MRIVSLPALTLFLCAAVYADFSYTTTRKTTGGMMASLAGAAAAPQTSRYYFKGRKMKTENATTVSILDFEAQTITTLNIDQKTYTVRGFGDIAAAAKSADVEASIDVKETGRKKIVNGYNASELVMTMEVDSPPQARQMGKMQMEVDMWLSPDVPGYPELHAFYQKNARDFPWAVMAAGANPSIQKAMADLTKKMASMPGVQVESIMRVKPDGGPDGASGAQMDQMQQAMSKACPQMQSMMAQGGPAAAAIKQQYDRMCGGAASLPAAPARSSNALIEITMDSSDFSTAGIPDSVFAIPAGFTRTN